MDTNTQETKLSFFRSMRGKLVLWFLLLSLIPLAVVGTLTYLQAQEALQQAAYNQLEAVRENKRNEIIRLFQVWEADVLDVSSDPDIVEGVVELSEGFESLGANSVRSRYLGQDSLEDAGDGSPYSAAHGRQHGFFLGYTEIHGYEDAFLLDSNGNVVYSTHKGEVFGTNLASGSYQDSNLGELYQQLKTRHWARSTLPMLPSLAMK